MINTDKAATYGAAIAALKKERKLSPDTQHRHVQYLNNRLEADHGKLKRLIKPTLGFQSLKTALATITGFEVTRALKKGQGALFRYLPGIAGEVTAPALRWGPGPHSAARRPYLPQTRSSTCGRP